MSIILVTGSAGLVGSESVSFFSKKKFKIIGIDNNFRKYFFGINGSTLGRRNDLIKKYNNYTHFDIDIRNYIELEKILKDTKIISHVSFIQPHNHLMIGQLKNL